MSNSIPQIPDNAPFSPEQRAWLNGFLASLFSSAPAAASVPAGKRIAVLYASQSGTAEGLARKLAKELKAQGHTPAVSTLVGYTPAALAAESHALILASTYGDGDAPDGVQPFYEQLCLEHFPRMEKLHYSVFALGDKHYEHFCKFGADLDAKLAALGANPICSRVDSDVEVEQPFADWKAAVLAQVNKNDAARIFAPPPAAAAIAEVKSDDAVKPARVAEPSISRDNPLLARLVDKRSLTKGAAAKVTIHLAFSTEDGRLTYEAGDAFGVIPSNDPNLVAEILQRLGFNGNEQVPRGNSGSTTLHEALLHNLQITRLSRKIVQEYAKRGNCAQLLAMLLPEAQSKLEQYVSERGLIDLLVEFPGVLDDPADLVAMLPRLTPRLYSISSSPAAHAGQVHATVAVVRYFANQRERGGVCSTLLADRTTLSDRLPIYIQPNKKFRLPADPSAPIVMIGPGTGIAPFRGFLHERRALGHTGRNWLFFGGRSASADFLYREELESMRADGHLTRLDTAFSRDQEHKVYVQDRMMEHSRLFWQWLQEGASVYVCGDASRMAKDVNAAMRKIAEQEGGFSHEQAEEYMAHLKDQHRYHRDVY
ncbi:sulfite reductase subunit alpha [Occallatibacter riparius]|uniref:assimilatory sulfite reductase (NADPH) n=1 Tax=Occallatibacter riparius TaxID=1002689 RepID=A0A9J7BY01_9BACT|nr:sulfite reductase subunit alpha [Occallatibacter riparius]UWZ86914.1 sulfite reductase subunit alpha [Occallatibacter riparius]